MGGVACCSVALVKSGCFQGEARLATEVKMGGISREIRNTVTISNEKIYK